jgi:two-component system chemotaxis response regulator CheB
MFRSAAGAYGERVAGVPLSGLLDDGAAGLWEIQQHGGATIVQEPEEATFSAMPESAIRGLNVQYIVRLAEMAPLLTKLTMADHDQIPSESPGAAPLIEGGGQACPECGGAMTSVKMGGLLEYRCMGGLLEYRCHIGHRIGLQTMIAQKSNVVEHALGVALSQSEELIDLLERALQESASNDRQTFEMEIAKRRQEQESLRGLTGSSTLTY